MKSSMLAMNHIPTKQGQALGLVDRQQPQAHASQFTILFNFM